MSAALVRNESPFSYFSNSLVLKAQSSKNVSNLEKLFSSLIKSPKINQAFSNTRLSQLVDAAEAKLKRRIITKIKKEHLKPATLKDWNRIAKLYLRIPSSKNLDVLKRVFENYFSRMLREAESEKQFKQNLCSMKKLPLTYISLRKLDRNKKIDSKAMLTEAFIAFSEMASLKTLDVSGCKELRDIHWLSLTTRSIKDLKASGTKLRGENLDNLSCELEVINLSKSKIEDKYIFPFLEKQKLLKHINLSYCEKIRGPIFECLKTNALETLNLSGCPKIANKNICFLNETSSLKSLELSSLQIEKEGFNSEQYFIEKFTLSGKATTLSLSRIARSFPYLANLYLTNCEEIEKEAFIPFQSITSLKVVDLYEVNHSLIKGVEDLQKVMPSTEFNIRTVKKGE